MAYERPRSFLWACLFASGLSASACAPSSREDASPTPSASAPPAASSGPTAEDEPGPFTGRRAARKLRRRLVAQTLATSDDELRLRRARTAFAAVPEGDESELALLEGLDVMLRAPPRSATYERTTVTLLAASRWLARGEPARARALLDPRRNLAAGRDPAEREMLVDLLFRLEGREAAVARGTEPDGSERVLVVARAEARYGDFRRATAVARATDDLYACRIWNALVVRHVRDGREPDAALAIERARRASEPAGKLAGASLECLVDFARAASAVGAADEVSRVFAQLPTDYVWPACRVLDALATGFDPIRLDVVVDVVALPRDPLQDPSPNCYFDASVAASRAGRRDLGRSLRARGARRAKGFELVYLGSSRPHLVAFALGEVDPFVSPEPKPFQAEDVVLLGVLLDERPDAVFDASAFERAFPPTLDP